MNEIALLKEKEGKRKRFFYDGIQEKRKLLQTNGDLIIMITPSLVHGEPTWIFNLSLMFKLALCYVYLLLHLKGTKKHR